MKTILAAIIILVAIAGPTVLLLVLSWRRNPDYPPPWRRTSEHLDNPNPDQEPYRRPSWQGGFHLFGGGDGGGESGGS